MLTSFVLAGVTYQASTTCASVGCMCSRQIGGVADQLRFTTDWSIQIDQSNSSSSSCVTQYRSSASSTFSWKAQA